MSPSTPREDARSPKETATPRENDSETPGGSIEPASKVRRWLPLSLLVIACAALGTLSMYNDVVRTAFGYGLAVSTLLFLIFLFFAIVTWFLERFNDTREEPTDREESK